jgi:hypothetical protein
LNKIKNGSKSITPREDPENYQNENVDSLSNVAERQTQPTHTLEQANQVSIDHGLEYDDYDAWTQGTNAEIYRKSSNPNNVDLSQFDLSQEAFTNAKINYQQNKIDSLNRSYNHVPANPQSPENVTIVAETEADLNRYLENAMDNVKYYQNQITILKSVKQTSSVRKQIANCERGIFDEQVKIREIEQKLPSPKNQPKSPNTISVTPETSKAETIDERIENAIQNGNYEQWEAAMMQKGLSQNPKGKLFNATNFGITREKFDELVYNQNNTPVAIPENIQSPIIENITANPESTISPEQREEVSRYIETKIASKYKITTFEQGVSNNGELSDLNPTEKMKNAQEIVIGDLHGDIKKFVEHLVLSEMAYLSKDDIEKFYAITENGNDSGNYSDPSKMKELTNILSKVRWIGGNREFKLVGDVLSDRNGNDLVMVMYINQLRSKGANILTLSGNHDHNAFLPNNGVLGGRLHGQANSMLNARESAGFQTQTDYFTNPEIQKEYLQYAKNLKVFEFNPETQTLIAHAPIFEKTFQQWHKIMVHKKIITETNFNKLDIGDFTEKLNGFYQSYLQELILKGQSGKTMEDYLMNEDTALLFARNGGDNGQSQDLPTFNGQIKVLINGHNTCENSPTSSKGLVGNKDFVNVCLDNSAGKYDDETGHDSPIFLVPGQKQFVQAPTISNPQTNVNTAINSAPVAPTQPPAPRQFPIPPKPVNQVSPPTTNINSAPQIPTPVESVESQESINFDPKSYGVAAQKFIDNAFSDKLSKLQLENEIKAFTTTNWGYSDSIFKNSQGKEMPKKTIESMVTTNQTAERFSQSSNFEEFLGSFLDHMSYVHGGSIYRNYKYNSFMYLALSRMD